MMRQRNAVLPTKGSEENFSSGAEGSVTRLKSTAIGNSSARHTSSHQQGLHGDASATGAPPYTASGTRSGPENVERTFPGMLQTLWLRAMDQLPYRASSYFVGSLPPLHELMLKRMREQYGRPYMRENSMDADMLKRLWNGHNRVVFAPETLAFSADAHTVNARWKEMGFQGEDPSTDFRGAGLFGLVQLVYLVERHPHQWSASLSPDFLVAAAGLNVTMRLMTLLGLNPSVNQFSASILSTYSACEARLQLCRFMHDPDIEVCARRLHEVYCFTMRLLHYRWMRSSRNIMEFNQLLSAIYVELDRLLFLSGSLEELCSLV